MTDILAAASVVPMVVAVPGRTGLPAAVSLPLTASIAIMLAASARCRPLLRVLPFVALHPAATRRRRGRRQLAAVPLARRRAALRPGPRRRRRSRRRRHPPRVSTDRGARRRRAGPQQRRGRRRADGRSFSVRCIRSWRCRRPHVTVRGGPAAWQAIVRGAAAARVGFRSRAGPAGGIDIRRRPGARAATGLRVMPCAAGAPVAALDAIPRWRCATGLPAFRSRGPATLLSLGFRCAPAARRLVL
jgi:hypothetical protein